MEKNIKNIPWIYYFPMGSNYFPIIFFMKNLGSPVPLLQDPVPLLQ